MATSRRRAPPIRIRRATVKDLDVLVHQRRQMWRDISGSSTEDLDPADAAYRRWARQRMQSGRLVAFVAETKAREVVAGGAVWVREIQPRPGAALRRQPYLLSMYTEPAFRGKGLATKIVKTAIAWAKARGFPSMTLHASDLGRGVYEKLGFRMTTEMRLRFARR
ncbi:MAG: GNAT family N-acetyltransferase [Methanobacteriota archaeon]|nr:MAG: GNAT family N-acetyltransferase [Euryarchaeota archaeon]